LVEGQERNTAQLERIKTTVEWKWDSKEDLQNYWEESEVEVEIMRRGLRMALGKVRRRRLCHLPLIIIVVLFSIVSL